MSNLCLLFSNVISLDLSGLIYITLLVISSFQEAKNPKLLSLNSSPQFYPSNS